MNNLRQRESWYSRTKKELEEMDYKEKYEKALERARKLNADNLLSDEAIEEIFSELRESEDVKIIGKIIDCLNRAVDANYITLADRVKCLAYLAEPKEVKDPFDDEQFRRGYEAGKHDAMKEQKPRDYRKLYEEVVNSDWFKENYKGKSLGEEQPTNSGIPKESKPVQNPKKGCPTYPLSVVGDLLAEQKPAELTPLATLLSNYLKNDFEYFATKKWDEKKWNEILTIQASELLRYAKKELEKEQKPITESKRLANEVIEYLTKCGYSPVLKDDSKKEHFHIDIPRHKDDFWQSKEYKHCRSVLGEYYMEGDYGGDTYTLYIWREKKEQKPVEIHIENPNIQKFDPDIKLTTSDSSASGDELLYVSNKSYNIGYRDGKMEAKQKPAEWSKNDTAFLNDITDFFENKTVRLQHDLDMYAHWLKNLPERFVPQSKPEWSAEDECRREGIIQWLREYQKKFNPEYDSLSIESIESLIDWFKSLRPSWKPREVHLSALLAIFNDPNNIGSQTCQLALTDLYEQLKEL